MAKNLSTEPGAKTDRQHFGGGYAASLRKNHDAAMELRSIKKPHVLQAGGGAEV